MAEKFKRLASPYFSFKGEKTTIQVGDTITCRGNNEFSITRNNEPVQYHISTNEPGKDKFIIENISNFLSSTGAAVGLTVQICETSASKWIFTK